VVRKDSQRNSDTEPSGAKLEPQDSPKSEQKRNEDGKPKPVSQPKSDAFSDFDNATKVSAATTNSKSWSDMVEEDLSARKPQSTTAASPSAAYPVSLLIEIAIIYARALPSKQPRKALRGILDQTKKTTTGKAFKLSFGDKETLVYWIAIHRHSYNHTTTLAGTSPPYLNSTAPPCKLTSCPLNQWTLIPEALDRQTSASLLHQCNSALSNMIKSLPMSRQDVEDTNRQLAFLKTLTSSQYRETVRLCELALGTPADDKSAANTPKASLGPQKS